MIRGLSGIKFNEKYTNELENKMNKIDEQNLDKIQLWTQNEMLSAILAGIVIGFSIALAVFK